MNYMAIAKTNKSYRRISGAVIDNDDMLRAAALLGQTAQACERALRVVGVGEYSTDRGHGADYATTGGCFQDKSCYVGGIL